MKTLILGAITLSATALFWYKLLIHKEYISSEEIKPNFYSVVYKQAGAESRITAHISVLKDYGFNEKEIIKKSKEIR